MGIHDRDYVNSSRGMGSSNGGGGGQNIFARAPGWTVTTWIIVINVAIHFLATTSFSGLYDFGQLSVYSAIQRLEVWRLITFQFLHDPNSILHVLFNMFGMWVFGPMVEQYLGRKKYLAFYLICGLSGGLLFIILNVLGAYTPLNILKDGFQTPLIGASAGVFGVIVACAFVSPNSVIRLLFPPIPLKMQTFAYGYVAIALFSLLRGSPNAGGEAAHIGGAIAGYFFIRHSHFLTDFFDIFGDSRKPKKSKAGKKKSSYRSYKNSSGPSQDDIDKILQKVSQKGLASLSDKEKKLLALASKNDD
ncbi:MAG: rhomboid family intramembrane serine protease [Phycisphaerales bacterium]|nr:rhomboid family intramembrane serine protease [Phycisphaerales bacterium]